MLGTKDALVKGNQSIAIEHDLSSFFWMTRSLCVLGRGICCVMMGVMSASVGLVVCSKGDLPCPPSMEWGMIALVLQHDAQHASYVDISMWRAT